MIHMLVSWVIITVSILVAAHLIPGIRVSGIQEAFIAAAVLGLLNVLLRPILVFLTFPITFLTFGLFLFVINAFVFWLVGNVLRGFSVNSFYDAFLGSLVVTVISYVTDFFR